MFFTLEQKQKFTNCPHCELTDTFLSAYNNASSCVRCHQLYDRTDEVLLRKQKMEVPVNCLIHLAQICLWTINLSNVNVTVVSLNENPMLFKI